MRNQIFVVRLESYYRGLHIVCFCPQRARAGVVGTGVGTWNSMGECEYIVDRRIPNIKVPHKAHVWAWVELRRGNFALRMVFT